MKFNLTYQTVTDYSAQNGDFSHHGYLSRSGTFNPSRNYFPKKPAGFRLREAIDIFMRHGGVTEADSCPISRQHPPRWFTRTDEQTSPAWVDYHNAYGKRDVILSVGLSLHLPANITAASAMRIARLVGSYGIRA